MHNNFDPGGRMQSTMNSIANIQTKFRSGYHPWLGHYLVGNKFLS